MALSREEILATDKTASITEHVPVPEWGGDVIIRRMSVFEEERFWQICDDARKGVDAPTGQRGALVLMCCLKDDGTSLFNAEDAAWLGSKANREAVHRVHVAIQKLSGVTAEAQAAIEKKPETPKSSSLNGSLTDGESGTPTT